MPSDGENEQQESVEAQTQTDLQDLGEAIGYLDPSNTAQLQNIDSNTEMVASKKNRKGDRTKSDRTLSKDSGTMS